MSKASKIAEIIATVIKYIKEHLEAEFFVGRNGEPMVTIRENGMVQSFDLRREKWKFWLLIFVRKQKWAISRYCLDEIINELVATATVSGIQRDLFIRVADYKNEIIVDLSRPDFRFVHISKNGFVVNNDCPVAFLRPSKQLPLPIPIKCKRKDFITLYKRWFCGTNGHWPLILAFHLKSLFRNHGPYVLLIVTGEKDAGKSLLCRRIQSLIDPTDPPFLTTPKVVDNVVVASANSYLFVYDNISGINSEMADIFCSVSTGGGISKRKLYADHEETSYRIYNPCLFNGLDEPSNRADFMDRTITFELPALTDEKRLSPTKMLREFEKDYSRLLGGLYELLADCMKILPSIPEKGLPRMADFARMGIAAEQILGLDPGSFLRAYKENRNEQLENAFWTDGLCNAIHRKLSRKEKISGTATELHQRLFTRGIREPALQAPKSVAHFSSWLDRVEALLTYKGIVVERSRTALSRTITIRWKDPAAHPVALSIRDQREAAYKSQEREDYDI